MSIVCRALVASLLLALAAGSTARAGGEEGAAAPYATPTFVITGRGWGHGVGMSQWGAYGFAREGWTYDRILRHYYRGTRFGPAPLSRVRVLLAEDARSLTLSSETPFRVRDEAGKVHRLTAGAHSVGPELRLRVGREKRARALPGPLLFLRGEAPLELERPYRGSIRVISAGRKLQAVNVVGLEAYLYGVVPDEVPEWWPNEALKAQAVAARSYAMATRSEGDFDLYDDVRSQVYGGIEAEEAATTAAVDATAGRVLLYADRVATAFFFSTSGGRTASVEEIFTKAAPTPYLTSVRDPFDLASPHHTWGPFRFAPATLRRTLKVPGKLLDVQTATGRSGRVRSLAGLGSGGTASISGSEARELLGLRSTWFRVGVLALSPPPAPVVTYGSQVTLTGIARHLAPRSLEQRPAGSGWSSLVPLPGSGSFATPVAPRVATTYRVAGGEYRSAEVRVRVAPLVHLRAVARAEGLAGEVRPPLAGSTVEIDRYDGELWQPVGRTTLDREGAFAPALRTTPGTYRARIAAVAGYEPGVSANLRVGSP